jgi:hypothetical protein
MVENFFNSIYILFTLFPVLIPIYYYQGEFIEHIKSDITQIGIKLFTVYTDVLYEYEIKYKELYKTNTFFQVTVDELKDIYNYSHALVFDYKLEPKENNWINISILNNVINLDSYYLKFILDEKYDVMEEIDEKKRRIIHEDYKNTMKNINKNNLISLLIIVKKNNKYHTITNMSNSIDYDSIKSNVKFLSIEYEDPLLKEKVPIVLTDEYFYENNEILSAAFIKRYLEYNPVSVNYSSNYKIHIMDNEINMITLTNKDYIILHKNNYDIINNK